MVERDAQDAIRKTHRVRAREVTTHRVARDVMRREQQLCRERSEAIGLRRDVVRFVVLAGALPEAGKIGRDHAKACNSGGLPRGSITIASIPS